MLHGLVVAALISYARNHATKTAAEKGTPVAFIARAHAPAPTASAPPPPPPPPKRTSTPHRKPMVIPTKVQPIQMPPPTQQPVPEAPPPDPEGAVDNGSDNGVAGGVPGGVAGGVPGGVVGGTGVGNGEPVKPKNVPIFVIQRDAIRQEKPRLSEVFKTSHRGQPPIMGQYRVFVGIDGHVYNVEVVKSVPGADDDIVNGIKDGWEFKPQQVPVSFLYNIPVRVE